MPPVLLDLGIEAARRGGYATFSAYIQALLRERSSAQLVQAQLL
jgi:hypothetical protein